MKADYSFQYCQKIILFNSEQTAVLLARRKGELDYDGIYSFIGGKLETADGGIIAGLKREKDEEIGEGVRVRVCPFFSCYNAYFIKQDGSAMILPHYYAVHQAGDIIINEEYDDYKWVNIDGLSVFKPKIETIEEAVKWALRMKAILTKDDFIDI